MSDRIIAMVPVRAGSVRVPNKNTRPFHDTTLLALKLKVLKRLRKISKIVVSTDCDVAASIASDENIDIQWRDKHFAGSDITNDQHWLHIAETTPGDIVFFSQVTSPLLKLSSMQKAVDSFSNLGSHDSLNSVSKVKEYLWLDGKPLNYEEGIVPKTQDLPDILALNWAINIIAREKMIERRNVVGVNPNFFELNEIEAIDIDEMPDFKMAEYFYKEYGFNWLLN